MCQLGNWLNPPSFDHMGTLCYELSTGVSIMKIKFIYSVSFLFVISLVLFSCDPITEDSDDNNTTNNINNINNINNTTTNNVNNINNINNVNNDVPGDCSASDLPFQNECNPGYKCTIINDSLEVGCIKNGPLDVGDNCMVVTSTVSQDGCPSSSVCVPYEDQPICMNYCYQLYTPCSDEQICVIDLEVQGGHAYMCDFLDDCNPYVNEPSGADATEGCSAGEVCHAFYQGSIITKCMVSEGTGMKGTPCVDSTECAPGHVCYGGYGDKECRFLCEPSTNDDCGIDYCVKVSESDSFGICQ
jgi:hypothetical protein